MISEATKRVLVHEGQIALGIPFLCTAFWFACNLLSINPPFFYYGLGFVGCAAALQLDLNTPGLFDELHILMLRMTISATGITIGFVFNGIFGLVIGTSAPFGPFSSLASFLAFGTLICITREAHILYRMFSEYNFGAIVDYFRDNAPAVPIGGADGAAAAAAAAAGAAAAGAAVAGAGAHAAGSGVLGAGLGAHGAGSGAVGAHPAGSGALGAHPAGSGALGAHTAGSGALGAHTAGSGAVGAHPAGSGALGAHPAGSGALGAHPAGSGAVGAHPAGSGTGAHPAGSGTGAHPAGSGTGAHGGASHPGGHNP